MLNCLPYKKYPDQAGNIMEGQIAGLDKDRRDYRLLLLRRVRLPENHVLKVDGIRR